MPRYLVGVRVEHRRDATEGCADGGSVARQLLQDMAQIIGEVGDPVESAGGPAALAVAPHVEGDGVAAGLGEPLCRAAPRLTGLPATVKQNHGGCGFVSKGRRHQAQARGRIEFELGLSHSSTSGYIPTISSSAPIDHDWVGGWVG